MVEILFDFESVRLFEQAWNAAPDLFDSMLLEVGRQAVDVLHADIAVYPSVPSYPINWDSGRQRRAFFATNGFGGGIPHVRNGGLPRSWQKDVQLVTSGNVRGVAGQVFTNLPGAKYVQDADYQSRIHEGRWQTVQSVLLQDAPEVTELFRQAAEITLDLTARQMEREP